MISSKPIQYFQDFFAKGATWLQVLARICLMKKRTQGAAIHLERGGMIFSMGKPLGRRIIARVDLFRLGKERFARKQGVTIGKGCRILSNIVTTEPWLISVGDRVTISSDVRLITHDGSGWLFSDDQGRRFRYAPITIGSDVFIGAGVTILPGITIGDRVVVGAGSVVTKSIPSETVVAGIPARPISSWKKFAAKIERWPSETDKRGDTYRDRVDSIVIFD